MVEIFEIGLTCHRCMTLKKKRVQIATLTSQHYISPTDVYDLFNRYMHEGAFLFCMDCTKEVREQFTMDEGGGHVYRGEEV